MNDVTERGPEPERDEHGEPAATGDANAVRVAGSEPAAVEAPTTILKAVGTKTPTPATELLRAEAGDVRATTLTMERSGAERVSGERVIMDRSGAKTLEARSAQLERSGVVTLKSEHAVLHGGSAISVVADRVRMVKGQALVVVGREVTVEGGARVLLQIGARSGDARPLIDARGAAGFGAALGFVVLGLGRLRRWMGR